MKFLGFVLWLLVSVTYGLAPLWVVGFGAGSIIFIVIQLVSPTTPILMPVIFYSLFVLSLLASTVQCGELRDRTTSAPPPMRKKR